MGKRKSERHELDEDLKIKLNDAGNFIPDSNPNKEHNTKKEALGPNTKR